MRDYQTLNESPADSVQKKMRIGDMAAMLRVMSPLNAAVVDPVAHRRRLLADLCRLLGKSVGADHHGSGELNGHPGLSRRQEQTLDLLLVGDSEKQIARILQLSQNTVHVYVKALYRRFGVSSRGELLAGQLKR